MNKRWLLVTGNGKLLSRLGTPPRAFCSGGAGAQGRDVVMLGGPAAHFLRQAQDEGGAKWMGSGLTSQGG